MAEPGYGAGQGYHHALRPSARGRLAFDPAQSAPMPRGAGTDAPAFARARSLSTRHDSYSRIHTNAPSSGNGAPSYYQTPQHQHGKRLADTPPHAAPTPYPHPHPRREPVPSYLGPSSTQFARSVSAPSPDPAAARRRTARIRETPPSRGDSLFTLRRPPGGLAGAQPRTPEQHAVPTPGRYHQPPYAPETPFRTAAQAGFEPPTPFARTTSARVAQTPYPTRAQSSGILRGGWADRREYDDADLEGMRRDSGLEPQPPTAGPGEDPTANGYSYRGREESDFTLVEPEPISALRDPPGATNGIGAPPLSAIINTELPAVSMVRQIQGLELRDRELGGQQVELRRLEAELEKRDREARDLRDQLGRVEARHRSSEEQMHGHATKERTQAEEILGLHRQVNALSASGQEKDSKIQVLEANLRSTDDFKRKIKVFEAYMKTCPTKEEFDDKVQTIDELSLERKTLEGFRAELEEETEALKLKIVQQAEELNTRKESYEELQRNYLLVNETHVNTENELRMLNNELTNERDRLRSGYDQISDSLLDANAQIGLLEQRLAQEKVLQQGQEAQSAEKDRAILALQQQAAQHTAEVQQLEAQLSGSESAIENLTRKLSAQATTIRELRASIETLMNQNQEIIAENQTLRAGGTVRPVAPRPVILPGSQLSAVESDKIQDALAACVEDLQSVMQLAMARLRGEDPAISQLLGLGPASDAKVFVRTSDARNQLETIKEMHQEVEKVRAAISEQYAADVGRDACVTQ